MKNEMYDNHRIRGLPSRFLALWGDLSPPLTFSLTGTKEIIMSTNTTNIIN